MNSEIIVVIAAILIAFLMALKPEMFVLNEARRTYKFIRAIRMIGISVCIVLLTMFIVTYLF